MFTIQTLTMYRTWLSVIIVGVVIVGFEGQTMGTTCESSGLGKPARVTCDFGQNGVKARDVSAVLLQRSPLRDTGGKQETVVECRRFLNEEFDCLFEVDYNLNSTVSDQLIINIPRAQRKHQGKYHCLIVTEQIAIQGDSCFLEYKEPNNAATSTPPSEQDSDDHLKKDNGTRLAELWIHTTIVLFVLLVIMLLFAVFVFVCRRH